MKKLLLTGLATEQPFFPRNGNPGGAAKYFLIFNDGDFRVEVSEQSAELCIKKMIEDSEEQEEPAPRVEKYDHTDSGPVMAKVGTTYSDDDDGVDQI